MEYDGVSVDLSTGVTHLFMEGRVITGAIKLLLLSADFLFFFFILKASSSIFRVCWVRNYKTIDETLNSSGGHWSRSDIL